MSAPPMCSASTPYSFTTATPRSATCSPSEGRSAWNDWSCPKLHAGASISHLRMIDHINEELKPVEEEIRSFARRQAGCKALMVHYGIGELTSVAILAELGDTRRFRSSRHAVRYAGLDVTVSQSDDKRAAGKLSRQGPPTLRWALFEAAQCAWRKGSPDHDYYIESKERLGGNRACLSIARKLVRKAHHTLRELGEEALLEPVGTVE